MTLPNNPTFDFSLSGVSGDLSLGKNGPRILNSNGSVEFVTFDNQPGNITVNHGFFSNIGVGTAQALYPVDVWGNIHISNTSTATSGIIWPDGTYQTTAAYPTLPSGGNGYVQFNQGNIFSSSNVFVWDINRSRLGIGTAQPTSKLHVLGNIAISNSAGITHGITFPDGTFQETAAFYTPSYGVPGTIQFAGSSNTFSGDGSRLSWNTDNGQLLVSNVLINSNEASTGPGSGALQVQGGVGIIGDLNVLGNITGGSNTIIVGNSGVFFGDSQGFGAIYGGIRSGYIYQPNTVLQLSANADEYSQLNLQNINPGTASSGDLVVTADNGSNNDTYIDLGINSGSFDQGTIDRANDGYLYVAGNAVTGGGNLVLGTLAANDIIFTQNGADPSNEVARFVYGQGLVLELNTASYSPTTGALITAGGLGVAGNGNFAGNLTVSYGTTGAVIIGNDPNGRIEIGQQGRASSGVPYIDFHSVAGSGDYDTRIQSSGGNAEQSGQGTLNLVAALVAVESNLQVGGQALVNSLISNANITSANLNIAGTAYLGSVYSNSTIQSAGNITVGGVNSNGSIVASQITSNSSIQAAGNITVGGVNSNGSIVASQLTSNTSIQAPGALTAGSVNSNGAVVGSQLTSNSTIQAAGVATVNELHSNSLIEAGGSITGLAINSNTYVHALNEIMAGSIYSNSTMQSAGLATVNSLSANASIYGANINVAGLAYVNSLISNTNVYGATLQSDGLATVDSLVVNNNSTTSTLVVRNGAQVGSISSNTTVISNGLVSGQQIRSNGFIEGATLKTTGLAVVNQLISNTEATANTLNIITNAVVQTLTSNTGIQAGISVLANTINSNLSITSPAINALNNLSSNTITSNVTLNAATVNASGVVRITNTAVSGSTGSGALIVTGGVGIGGNLNVGGLQSLFAGNLIVSGNLIVRGNSTIVNSNTINVTGPTIQVGSDNTEGNVLTYNDGYDRGIVMNYFILNDNNAFMGFQNSTGRFVYITNVQPGVSNLFNPFESVPGYVYGTAQFGTMYLSNSTISINSSTGALVVSGGVGIGGNVNALGQIATTGQGRFGQDLLANQLNSNTAISAVSTITGSSIHANNEVSSTNISASNSIKGFLIAANSSVTSTNITALNTITGNILVGNIAVITPNVQATTLVAAQNIISNSSIVTTTLLTGGQAQVNALNSNTNISSFNISATNLIISDLMVANVGITAGGTVTANVIIGNLAVVSPNVQVTNLLSAQTIVSNSSIVTTELLVGDAAVVNSLVSNTTVNADTINSNLIYNSSDVYTTRLTAAKRITGNTIVSNGVVSGDFVQGISGVNGGFITSNSYIIGDRIISNTYVKAQSLTISDSALINLLFVNTSIYSDHITASQLVQSNFILSNTGIQTAGLTLTDALYANVFISTPQTLYAGIIYSNGAVQAAGEVMVHSLISNTVVQAGGAGTFGSVTSNGTIQTASTVTGFGLISNSFVQANASIIGGSMISNSTVAAAGTITGDSLYSNSFIQANGTITGNQIESNGAIDGSSLNIRNNAIVNSLASNSIITASNLIVSNYTVFNVVVSNTSVTAGTLVRANQLIANVNVGIGTATVNYPLDVYGNIHIGNTATISGIVFPDGTFQDTAPIFTPSYGYQNTIQFAGNANTFSGDSSNLVWDNVNLALNTSNLVVINSANIGANASIGKNINLVGNLNGSNTTIIQGKTAILQGGAGGFGALYAGVQDYTNYQPNTVALFAGNANATVQLGVHNDSNGGTASGDIVITANNGTAYHTYINMGINSSGWNQNTVDGPNDGYLLVNGNTTTGGGNLILGTILNNDIIFTQNGVNAANVAARLVYGQGLVVYGTANSTSTSTGGLVTYGGLGVAGNAYIGGTLGVLNTAAFGANISVATNGAFGGNISLNGNLSVGSSANVSVNLTVGNNITAFSGSIGSFDQINSRGFANVQVLQSNGYVSGNTWVVDGNSYSSNSTFQQVVDAWSTGTFRSAQYMLQVTDTDNNSYQISQLLLVQDGIDVYFTEYADIYTASSLGSWSADIDSGSVELLFTPYSADNLTIKVVRTTIDI